MPFYICSKRHIISTESSISTCPVCNKNAKGFNLVRQLNKNDLTPEDDGKYVYNSKGEKTPSSAGSIRRVVSGAIKPLSLGNSSIPRNPVAPNSDSSAKRKHEGNPPKLSSSSVIDLTSSDDEEPQQKKQKNEGVNPLAKSESTFTVPGFNPEQPIDFGFGKSNVGSRVPKHSSVVSSPLRPPNSKAMSKQPTPKLHTPPPPIFSVNPSVNQGISPKIPSQNPFVSPNAKPVAQANNPNSSLPFVPAPFNIQSVMQKFATFCLINKFYIAYYIDTSKKQVYLTVKTLNPELAANPYTPGFVLLNGLFNHNILKYSFKAHTDKKIYTNYTLKSANIDNTGAQMSMSGVQFENMIKVNLLQSFQLDLDIGSIEKLHHYLKTNGYTLNTCNTYPRIRSFKLGVIADPQLNPFTPGVTPDTPGKIHRLYMSAAYALLHPFIHIKYGNEYYPRQSHSGLNIAAILISAKGEILAWGINTNKASIKDKWGENKMLHAEINMLSNFTAGQDENNLLALPQGSKIYTTLKPCHMCADAIYRMAGNNNIEVYYDMTDDNALDTTLDKQGNNPRVTLKKMENVRPVKFGKEFISLKPVWLSFEELKQMLSQGVVVKAWDDNLKAYNSVANADLYGQFGEKKPFMVSADLQHYTVKNAPTKTTVPLVARLIGSRNHVSLGDTLMQPEMTRAFDNLKTKFDNKLKNAKIKRDNKLSQIVTSDDRTLTSINQIYRVKKYLKKFLDALGIPNKDNEWINWL